MKKGVRGEKVGGRMEGEWRRGGGEEMRTAVGDDRQKALAYC